MQGWLVNINYMNNLASDLEKKHAVLGNARETVESIKNNCAVSGEARIAVTGVLNRIMEAMEQEEQGMETMGTSLHRTIALYRNCEKNIVGNTTVHAVTKETGGTATDKNNISWQWKDTWKLISKAGILGGIVGSFGNLVTGEGDIKTFLQSGKHLMNALGNVSSAMATSGARADWAPYIFGKNNVFGKIDTSSAGKAFQSSIHKQFVDDLNFSKAQGWNKGKVGTKWGSHALTAMINGVENIEEYKSGSVSAGRAVAETILETGADIAVGAGATAAVTAGAVALGFTSASAVAIGAAAVVVTWAANGVCKWATGGKDIGETVADAMCDMGEKAVSLVKNTGKVAHNVINSFKEVSIKWSKIFSFG